MDRATMRKLAALTLIVVLQLTNSYLYIAYKWTPPQKSNRKLSTMVMLSQLVFLSISCFQIAVHNVTVKLGRFHVQGLDNEFLLWAIVMWSAALVGVDIWYIPDSFMNLVQLFILDVITWMSIFGTVGLVDGRECGDQPATNEKTEKIEV